MPFRQQPHDARRGFLDRAAAIIKLYAERQERPAEKGTLAI